MAPAGDRRAARVGGVLPVHALPLRYRTRGPRLHFEAGHRKDAYDEVVDIAADSGWGLLELPPGFTLPSDDETVRTVATLAARVLARRGTAVSERGENPLDAGRIAVGVSHREQRSRVEAALVRLEPEVPGARSIVVDTANRLQGREFDVTVFLHPLSGRRDATAFHLETGRLCVLASRHRHACLVVARAGIPELLDAHPSSEPVHLGLPVSFPDGWEANQAVLGTLADNRVEL